MIATLSGVLVLGVVFARWTDQERVSARAGFYLLLAKTGVYNLQPEMVEVPGGSFLMGSPPSEKDSYDSERPQHEVKVKPFRIGRYEVTFDEYDVFTHRIESDGGCQDGHEVTSIIHDETWGRGRRPIINVGWQDAVCYAEWLSRKTGKHYRLPTEAEWEYAARAGTETSYWWGPEIGKNRANCRGCGSEWDGKQTSPVGSFSANPFGLHETAGNVEEWMEDCWHDNYEGAPADGTAWETGDCDRRVIRGGSWSGKPWGLRSAYRSWSNPVYRGSYLGFRLAQDF
jgi:formylglycine-generating enzyme required for sulfatase activity